MGAGSAPAYHTLYLEHFQRSSFAQASVQRQDRAVDGVHKPGQAQRQILPGLLLGFGDVIDDISNEKTIKKSKKYTKNFRFF